MNIYADIASIMENLARPPSAFTGQVFFFDANDEDTDFRGITDTRPAYAYLAFRETGVSVSETKRLGCGDYQTTAALRLVASLPCTFTDELVGAVFSRLVEFGGVQPVRMVLDAQRLYFEETGDVLPGEWNGIAIDFNLVSNISIASCAGHPCCDGNCNE